MPLRLPKVRGDLEFHDQEVEGESVVVVRDPIRGTYFKYNPLQAAMLRMLDGKRTLDEMVAALSLEFEVEIPRVAAERFVSHVRKQMLLDVSSYEVPDEKAKKEVFKALTKQGFRFRNVAGSETGVSTRVASAEAVLFMGGLRHLQSGSPAKALDYFAAVLELNPKNERAKILADTIQTAYVKTLSGSTTDFPTFVLFNPTRLLGFIDRTFGRFIFHWSALVLLGVLVAIAAYCFSITTYPSIEVGALDIALIVVLSTLDVLVHELGHGLACYHYGGAVSEIGVTLFYYLRPVPYCDTSSSYLFARRHDKIIVQAFGTLVTLTYVCVLLILLAVLQQDLFIYTPMLVIMWVSLFSLFINIIPLLKFDGYFALCDYTGVPNLRERSINLLKAWLSRRVLGLPAPEESLPSRKRRLFFVFAALCVAFTGLWMYYATFTLLAPVVERFRGMGLIIAGVFLGYQLRAVLLRPLKGLLVRVYEQRRQIFSPRRTLGLVLLVAVLIAPWTYRTPVRVDAEFSFTPKARLEVRATVPGIVDEILVREGDQVTQGQPLAILRSPELELRAEVLVADLAAIDARLAQLRQLARPEEIELAQQRLASARAAARLGSYRATQANVLARGGLGTGRDAAEASGAAAQARSMSSAAQSSLELVEAGARPEAIAAAEAAREQLSSELQHVRQSRELLTLRSPIAGVVATKHLHDRISSKLEPGDMLLEVHDASAFYAEIEVGPGVPLAEIETGSRIVLHPHGAPTGKVECTVARVRTQTTASGPRHVILTSTFTPTMRLAGLTGHARIYGRTRSLAYSELYLPLARVFRVELWSMVL